MEFVKKYILLFFLLFYIFAFFATYGMFTLLFGVENSSENIKTGIMVSIVSVTPWLIGYYIKKNKKWNEVSI